MPDRPLPIRGTTTQHRAVHAGDVDRFGDDTALDVRGVGQSGQTHRDPGQSLRQCHWRQPPEGVNTGSQGGRGHREHRARVIGQGRGALDVDRTDHRALEPHRDADLGGQSGDGRDELRVLGHVVQDDGRAGGDDAPDDPGAGGKPVDHLEVAQGGLAAQPPVDQQVHARQGVPLV